MGTRQRPNFELFTLPDETTTDIEVIPMGRRVVTTCIIRYKNVIGKGAAIRLPKDRRDDDLGRHIAFGRAKKNLYYGMLGAGLIGVSSNTTPVIHHCSLGMVNN